MKRRYLYPACFLTLVFVILLVLVLCCPELSSPFSPLVTRILWGLLADAVTLFWLLAIWKRSSGSPLSYIMLAIELAAVFLLVQSILTPHTTVFLCCALALNLIASVMNIIHLNAEKKREQK